MTPEITYRIDNPLSFRIWNWQLARQGLSERSRLASAVEIATCSLGLHAARAQSPFVTAAARAQSADSLVGILGDSPDAGLMTVRCMRKTLHVLPVGLAVDAHLATQRFRLRDTVRLARNASIDEIALMRGAALMVDLLAGKGLVSPVEAENLAMESGIARTDARWILKWAWESGLVRFVNATTDWRRVIRRFEVMPEDLAKQARESSVTEATRRLLAEYFRVYGPATVKDASWWSGLSQTAVRDALSVLDVVALELPWAQSPFYMRRQEFELFYASAADASTGVQLLAHEDVALKAYYESRFRYVAPEFVKSAFNQIGEVHPTILIDGQVVGRWRWNDQTHCIDLTMFRSVSLSELRSAEGVAESLGSLMRLALSN